MSAEEINFQTRVNHVNQTVPLTVAAKAETHNQRRAFGSDCLAPSDTHRKKAAEPTQQRAALDPLASKEAQPQSNGGYPITDSVFQGASAAYYAALFAFEAVKSMGDVQQAYNNQELDAFQELVNSWDSYQHEDGRFIEKQGEAQLVGGIVSVTIGVLGSVGSMLYGIGAPKGWFGGENLEQNIADYYRQNTDDSEFEIIGNKENDELENINELSESEIDNENELSGTTTEQQAQNRVKIEKLETAEEITTPRASQSASDPNEDTDEVDTETKKAEDKKAKGRVQEWQNQRQKKLTYFQSISQLVTALSQGASSVSQGVMQMQTSGIKENVDSWDKMKQITQQTLQAEDQGWSSAVQNLKEMNGTAANMINSLARAAQSA